MRDLHGLQRSWDEAGLADPLWAILTAPGKQGGAWDVDEFFSSGRAEIAAVLEYLSSLGLPISHRRALDFGCGVGRLTQALAEHFDEVDGVDIAPSMVEQARELNRHADRCHYHINAAPDLHLFPDGRFDLVYSNLVLQHVGPELACAYIREFVRVLAPGGVALFQLPSEPVDPAQQGAAAKPLPADAFRARVTPEQDRISGNPGDRVPLRVRVTNESSQPWPLPASPDGHDALNLGNHWRTRRGRMVALDDGRCGLPAPIPPGGEVELVLHVTLPAQGGTYVLELDMVQEHVAWFAARGSPTARVRADVGGRRLLFRRRPRTRGEEPAASWSREALAMHGVPSERVLAVLAAAGGRVLDTQEDHSAGSGWISFRYAVTKDGRPGAQPDACPDSLVLRGACTVCGRAATFTASDRANVRESLNCSECNCTSRYRGLARGILRALHALTGIEARSLASLYDVNLERHIDVYDTQTPFEYAPCSYTVPSQLGGCPSIAVHISSYLPDLQWGAELGERWSNQTLEALTFSDQSFDIVLTSDVMEHVRLDARAHREIARVLRPGGFYVFQVAHDRAGDRTEEFIRVVDPDDPEKDERLAPLGWHEDANTGGPSLVYRQYGFEALAEALRELDFEVEYVNEDSLGDGIVDTEVWVCRKG